VGSLNLHDAATLRWLCPASRSPAVPLLEGLIAGSDGVLELRSHLELRRDINCNATDRRWGGSTKEIGIRILIRRGGQRKENAQEALFKYEKRRQLICVTYYFKFISD
jgi:hypothetical protein